MEAIVATETALTSQEQYGDQNNRPTVLTEAHRERTFSPNRIDGSLENPWLSGNRIKEMEISSRRRSRG